MLTGCGQWPWRRPGRPIAGLWECSNSYSRFQKSTQSLWTRGVLVKNNNLSSISGRDWWTSSSTTVIWNRNQGENYREKQRKTNRHTNWFVCQCIALLRIQEKLFHAEQNTSNSSATVGEAECGSTAYAVQGSWDVIIVSLNTECRSRKPKKQKLNSVSGVSGFWRCTKWIE